MHGNLGGYWRRRAAYPFRLLHLRGPRDRHGIDASTSTNVCVRVCVPACVCVCEIPLYGSLVMINVLVIPTVRVQHQKATNLPKKICCWGVLSAQFALCRYVPVGGAPRITHWQSPPMAQYFPFILEEGRYLNQAVSLPITVIAVMLQLKYDWCQKHYNYLKQTLARYEAVTGFSDLRLVWNNVCLCCVCSLRYSIVRWEMKRNFFQFRACIARHIWVSVLFFIHTWYKERVNIIVEHHFTV